jgi:outer membrane immunogenic protein
MPRRGDRAASLAESLKPESAVKALFKRKYQRDHVSIDWWCCFLTNRHKTLIIRQWEGCMRRLRVPVALGLSIGFAVAASAADLPDNVYAAPPPLYVRTSVFYWTGFYLGVNGGWGEANLPNYDLNPNGWMTGGQFGYVQMWDTKVVTGIEIDGDFAQLKETQTGTVAGIPVSVTETMDGFGTVRGRLGYAFDRALLYSTAGFAWVHGNLSGTAAGLTVSTGGMHFGWTVGAGVEYAFNSNWTGKVEYLFADLGPQSYINSISSGNVQINTVRVGVNYLFHY